MELGLYPPIRSGFVGPQVAVRVARRPPPHVNSVEALLPRSDRFSCSHLRLHWACPPAARTATTEGRPPCAAAHVGPVLSASMLVVPVRLGIQLPRGAGELPGGPLADVSMSQRHRLVATLSLHPDRPFDDVAVPCGAPHGQSQLVLMTATAPQCCSRTCRTAATPTGEHLLTSASPSVHPRTKFNASQWPPKYHKLVASLSNGRAFAFCDARRFGKV